MTGKTAVVNRVEGKQKRDEGNVALDDVYMSFTVGLRWCWRFCRMLPGDSQRRRLSFPLLMCAHTSRGNESVRYMKGLRQTVTRALMQSLRMGGRADVEDDRTGPSATPAQAATRSAVPPAIATNDHELNALVAILALNRVLQTEAAYLNGVLRIFVAALHASGFHCQAGWMVRFRHYQRRALMPQEAYQEECIRLLRLERDRSEQSLSLRMRALKEDFRVTTTRMLLVCSGSPGPRYGWPGLKREAKRGRSGQQQLDGNTQNLLLLQRIVGPLVARFQSHHPLLKKLSAVASH